MNNRVGGLDRIWSVNEWGRLREIIVGNPCGAFIPSMEDVSQRNFDRLSEAELPKAIPQPMPRWIIEETLEDIAGLVSVLKSHGVRVHRAGSLDSTIPVHTPMWRAEQETCINIRDLTLIHGDVVIDAPSPTRGRYCESFAVRDLFDEYRSRSGHAWFVAPHRPRLRDETYDLSRPRGINEVEPLFDAANCVRLGRDILIEINNTANRAGASWIQQTLDKHFGAGSIKIHCVSLSSDHIDVVVVPLCEGHALVNPRYVSEGALPECLSGWTLIPSPEMTPQAYFSGTSKASNWIGMNLLVVDGQERTLIVEERQTELSRCLERNGFHPIPVRWRHGRTWGGGFHCVTLDVHRDAAL
jgi:glycine amidinotransferase